MSRDEYRVLKDHRAYRLIEEKSGPVEEANGFLRSLETRNLSSLTIRAYAFDLLILYRWMSKNGKALSELSSLDLLEFVAYQKEQGAHPNSINRRLLVCRCLFRFVTSREIEPKREAAIQTPYCRARGRDRALGIHAVGGVKSGNLRVKAPTKLIRPLDKGEVNHFFRSIKRYRDAAAVYLMLLCGLRSKEVLAMRLSDILFDDNSLRVMGKGSVERILPLPGILKDTIQNYLCLERPRESASPNLMVVLQGKKRGHSMTTAGLRSLFRIRRKRSGLASANPHRFRHTFGTDMARAGVSLPVLKTLLGHADYETTLHYIHLSMTDVTEEYRQALAEIRKRYEHK